MTETKIIICVGSGGVGKTTIASILGLHHALKGQKTLVITVDPARRLLDALDIAERGHMPKAIDIKRLTKREPKKGGALFALMPDLAHEWLDFLKASVSREKIRHEISSNHFYRYMADGLPGGLEIICSHILFRLRDASAFDTIILDTPPSSHSLTFFAVPERIVRVLEQSVFRTLVQKRASILLKLAKKLAFFSGGLLQKTLERIVGSHFLSELIDFALTIDGLYEPMLERAKSMDQLLKQRSTKYVLAVRPTVASVKDSFSLQKALKNRGLSIDQIVLNQVTPDFDLKTLSREKRRLKGRFSHEKAAAIDQALSAYVSTIALEKKLIERVSAAFKRQAMHTLFLSAAKDRASLMAELLENYEGAG